MISKIIDMDVVANEIVDAISGYQEYCYDERTEISFRAADVDAVKEILARNFPQKTEEI